MKIYRIHIHQHLRLFGKAIVWKYWSEVLLCVLLFLFSSTAYSSASTIDSLKAIIQTETNDSIKVRLYYTLGADLLNKSHNESLQYYQQCYELAKKTKDTMYMVHSLVGMCDFYNVIGEYKKAILYVTEAMDLLGDEDYNELSYCYGRLATVYADMGLNEKSKQYDRMSIACNRKINNREGLAYDYSNIATYFLDEVNPQPDSAIYYYSKATTYLDDTTDDLTSFIWGGLGDAYFFKAEYDKALRYQQKAYQNFLKSNSIYDLVYEENALASTFMKMQQNDSVLFYLSEAESHSKLLNNLSCLVDVYNLYYKYYNEQGDYKKALEYVRLEQAYSDSVSQKNNENKLNLVHYTIDIEEQQNILNSETAIHHKLVLHRTLLLIFFTISLSLLAAYLVLIYKRKQEIKQHTDLITQVDNGNYAIKRILSIIGHDLRDSVGNLKQFTRLMQYELLDNRSIKQMVQKFIPMVDSTHSLLETLLAWTRYNDDNFVPQYEQLNASELIQLTISHMEHVANAKKINLISDSEDVSFMADKNMMLTVLRNLVSNAIKYSDPGLDVVISANQKGDCLAFSVKDEGIGMNEEQVNLIFKEQNTTHTKGTLGESGSGLGLSLCHSFIMKHGGVLKVKSHPDKGSKFTFSIPIKNS